MFVRCSLWDLGEKGQGPVDNWVFTLNDIVDVIDSNTQLTHLNISDTNIQEYGILKIFKAVQRINISKSIKICNCAISDQAAQTIADAISVNCMMEELVFTNNDFHEIGISMVFDVLRKTHTMKCLTIASSYVVNTKNIIEVTEVVSSNHITHFDLSNCYLEKNSCLSILNSLTPQAPVLQHINLSGNNLSGTAETITQLISVSYYLQHVNLANTLMQGEEVMMIIKAMQNINSLHCVDLTSYSINDELAVELQNTIDKNPTVISFRFSKLFLKETKVTGMTLSKSIFNIVINLREITFCFTDCENNQVATAVTLIKNYPYIKYLHLENCSLLEIDISSIIVALSTTTTLKYVCLINFVITDNVDDGIATVLENNIHLKHFKLQACKITEKGLTKSIQSFSFTYLSHLFLSKLNYLISDTTRQLQRPICNSLTHLTLSYVCLDATKLSYLSLPAFTKLQYLDLSHNPLTVESANILSSVILNNNGLQHLDLCDCKLQSEGIRVVADSLQSINVTYLNMSLNAINVETFNNNLMPALLPNLNHIEYLYLPYCELIPKEIDKVTDFIDKAVNLKCIDLGPNVISKSMVNKFKDIMFINNGFKEITFSAKGIRQVSSINFENENLYNSLHYLNINNITVDDEVGNTVAALIANSPELKHLEMFGGKWNITSAMKCFRALQNNSHLVYLNFSADHSYLALSEIFNLLSGCTSLKVLELHNCFGLSDCSTMSIISPKFLHLDLSNNFIDDETVHYLSFLITTNFELEYLSFFNCKLSSSGIQSISSIVNRLRNLVYINFSHLKCSCEVVNNIISMINCNTKLRYINLCNCQLLTVDINPIIQAAKTLTTLENLDLSCNQVTSYLANDIITLIANNRNIEVLSFPNYTILMNNNHLKVVLNTVTDLLLNDVATIMMTTSKIVMEISLLNCSLNNDQLKVVLNAVNHSSSLSYVDFIIKEINNSSITDVKVLTENNSRLREFTKVFKLLVVQNMILLQDHDFVKLREIFHLGIIGCTVDIKGWNILKQLVHYNSLLNTLILSDCKLYSEISEIIEICSQLCFLDLTNVSYYCKK